MQHPSADGYEFNSGKIEGCHALCDKLHQTGLQAVGGFLAGGLVEVGEGDPDVPGHAAGGAGDDAHAMLPDQPLHHLVIRLTACRVRMLNFGM